MKMKGAILTAMSVLLLALQLFLPANVRSAAQDEWATLVAKAKQEGKLVLIGPSGPDRRDSLTLPFQQKYGIEIEYLPDPSTTIATRVSTERQAGKYLRDVVIA